MATVTPLAISNLGSIVAGPGLSGGTISSSGTISADWNAGTVSALGSGLALNTGTLQVEALDYAQMPSEIQALPLAFILPGKPIASQVYNLVMAIGVTIPANLAGTVLYDSTQASANAVFSINKISAGISSSIATITISPTSHTSLSLSSQPQVSFAAGDILQLVAPSVQDATLSDLGITILAMRL